MSQLTPSFPFQTFHILQQQTPVGTEAAAWTHLPLTSTPTHCWDSVGGSEWHPEIKKKTTTTAGKHLVPFRCWRFIRPTSSFAETRTKTEQPQKRSRREAARPGSPAPPAPGEAARPGAPPDRFGSGSGAGRTPAPACCGSLSASWSSSDRQQGKKSLIRTDCWTFMVVPVRFPGLAWTREGPDGLILSDGSVAKKCTHVRVAVL